MSGVRRLTEKRATVEQAAARAARWRAAGERVAVARGAFDLLDVVQLQALERARAGAARLVVAVLGDRAARAALGPGRPLLSAEDRALLVAALEVVDLAVVDERGDPAPWMEALGPGLEARVVEAGPATGARRDAVARVRERAAEE